MPSSQAEWEADRTRCGDPHSSAPPPSDAYPTARMKLASLVLALGLGATVVAESPQGRPSETLDGLILPYRTVNLGAATDGLLEEVRVQRGDLVERGQVLALLENRVERASAEYAERQSESHARRRMAEVRLASARERATARATLLEEGIVTPEEAEEARTALEIAELELLQAREQALLSEIEHRRTAAIVARGVVHSPIDGVVTEVLRMPGELVTSSADGHVLSVAQLDPLIVEVHAPVHWLGRIAEGDIAIIEAESGLPHSVQAELTVIDRVADPASETVRLRFELPNPDLLLPAGLRCKLHLSD